MYVSKVPVLWPLNSSIRARSRSTRRRGSQQRRSSNFSRAFFARFVPLMCVDETLVLLALATGRFRGSAGSKSRVSARARSPKISLLPIAGGGICGPNKARRRPRRKVQRINVSSWPVRNAETIGIYNLIHAVDTSRAGAVTRDRNPEVRRTGRGKAAAHFF